MATTHVKLEFDNKSLETLLYNFVEKLAYVKSSQPIIQGIMYPLNDMTHKSHFVIDNDVDINSFDYLVKDKFFNLNLPATIPNAFSDYLVDTYLNVNCKLVNFINSKKHVHQMIDNFKLESQNQDRFNITNNKSTFSIMDSLRYVFSKISPSNVYLYKPSYYGLLRDMDELNNNNDKRKEDVIQFYLDLLDQDEDSDYEQSDNTTESEDNDTNISDNEEEEPISELNPDDQTLSDFDPASDEEIRDVESEYQPSSDEDNSSVDEFVEEDLKQIAKELDGDNIAIDEPTEDIVEDNMDDAISVSTEENDDFVDYKIDALEETPTPTISLKPIYEIPEELQTYEYYSENVVQNIDMTEVGKNIVTEVERKLELLAEHLKKNNNFYDIGVYLNNNIFVDKLSGIKNVSDIQYTFLIDQQQKYRNAPDIEKYFKDRMKYGSGLNDQNKPIFKHPLFDTPTFISRNIGKITNSVEPATLDMFRYREFRCRFNILRDTFKFSAIPEFDDYALFSVKFRKDYSKAGRPLRKRVHTLYLPNDIPDYSNCNDRNVLLDPVVLQHYLPVELKDISETK